MHGTNCDYKAKEDIFPLNSAGAGSRIWTDQPISKEACEASKQNSTTWAKSANETPTTTSMPVLLKDLVPRALSKDVLACLKKMSWYIWNQGHRRFAA